MERASDSLSAYSEYRKPCDSVSESGKVCQIPPGKLGGPLPHGALERALRRFVRADLLVIDDFAVLAMDAAQAKLAFQVISERYEFRRSTCITTNRAFKDWTKVFPDALNAQVIAERLTERAEHFVLEKGFRNARP